MAEEAQTTTTGTSDANGAGGPVAPPADTAPKESKPSVSPQQAASDKRRQQIEDAVKQYKESGPAEPDAPAAPPKETSDVETQPTAPKQPSEQATPPDDAGEAKAKAPAGDPQAPADPAPAKDVPVESRFGLSDKTQAMVNALPAEARAAFDAVQAEFRAAAVKIGHQLQSAGQEARALHKAVEADDIKDIFVANQPRAPQVQAVLREFRYSRQQPLDYIEKFAAMHGIQKTELDQLVQQLAGGNTTGAAGAGTTTATSNDAAAPQSETDVEKLFAENEYDDEATKAGKRAMKEQFLQMREYNQKQQQQQQQQQKAVEYAQWAAPYMQYMDQWALTKTADGKSQFPMLADVDQTSQQFTVLATAISQAALAMLGSGQQVSDAMLATLYRETIDGNAQLKQLEEAMLQKNQPAETPPAAPQETKPAESKEPARPSEPPKTSKTDSGAPSNSSMRGDPERSGDEPPKGMDNRQAARWAIEQRKRNQQRAAA